MMHVFKLLALIFILSLPLACTTPAQLAQGEDDGGGKGQDLDALFARLKATPSDEEAQIIEVAIFHQWSESGSPQVDALILQGAEAVNDGDYDLALAVFDRVVQLNPNFAEGWNMRATVHFLREDYGAAIADIQRVLILEPRHFGALAGLGRIFLELDEERAALSAFEAALAINPHLESAREQVEQLRESLAGVPT